MLDGNIKKMKCDMCDGRGSYEIQVEYASYQSGHQLGKDIFEERKCDQCGGLGEMVYLVRDDDDQKALKCSNE